MWEIVLIHSNEFIRTSYMCITHRPIGSQKDDSSNAKYLFFSVIRLYNNPKNLDPSYKTYLDLWDHLGIAKVVLQQLFIRLI